MLEREYLLDYVGLYKYIFLIDLLQNLTLWISLKIQCEQFTNIFQFQRTSIKHF